MEIGNDPREKSLRAEEIIAAVYGRIVQVREEGRTPTSIVLPPALYRTLQDYRARLGDAPAGLTDYLGKYELFGVPLYTDSGTEIVIRATKRAEKRD